MYAFDGTESVNDLAKHSKPELIKVHMRLYVAADKVCVMCVQKQNWIPAEGIRDSTDS